MQAGNQTLDFSRTVIMGILNVTPDSFSDGGQFVDVEKAVARAKEMVSQGADIIDVGGESSRPGSDPVSQEEELKRVLPVVKRLVEELDLPISIDSYKPHVVEECLKLGAHIVNDIGGLRDPAMVDVVSRFNVPVVIMHMLGKPKTMQENISYDNVVDDIYSFFKGKVKEIKEKGVHKIILDPGIGFGKTVEHNLLILQNLKRFKELNCPLLIGTSRKSFIGKILDTPIDQRVEGTIAADSVAIMNGANIIRVHDVKEAVRAARIVDVIKNVK